MHIRILILLLCFASATSRAQIMLEGSIIDTHTVASGLDIPWEIQWGPEGWIWVTERYGIVSRINPQTSEKKVLADLTNIVHQQGESGLLGMAFHPSFPQDNRVYLVYTYLNGGQILERLVAYHFENGVLTNPSIMIDGIPGNTTHDGSRLIFGPDQLLYMSTGDAQNQSAPQDLESLNGKILRLEPNGSIPEGNPYGNYVYSHGHRNAQGLYFFDQRLYSSEHGPNTDDELNILEAGKNYGWEPVHGYCDTPSEQTFCEDSNVVEPIIAWTPTIATSDIVIYENDAIPGLTGKILLTTLKEKDLRVLELNSNGGQIISESIYFDEWWGRLRDVLVAPDGRIFIATNGFTWGESGTFRHSIIEISNPQVHGAVEVEMGTPTQKLYFYPNPSKAWPHLVGQSTDMRARYELFDSTGGIVSTGKLENFARLDLESGTYHMILDAYDGRKSGSFVISE